MEKTVRLLAAAGVLMLLAGAIFVFLRQWICAGLLLAGAFGCLIATLRRELYNKRLLNRTAELAWRIGLMECFPAWRFDLNQLTCRNTHGDYFISQLLCEDGHLTTVIDWTTACIHPVIWELMRSFVYAAPCCADGSIDRSLLARCVHAYCRYGTLNDYDLKNLERLYLYQIAVCDYYGQYYASAAANRHIYLQPAQHATHLLRQVFG